MQSAAMITVKTLQYIFVSAPSFLFVNVIATPAIDKPDPVISNK